MLLLVVFVPLFLLQTFTFYKWYEERKEAQMQANLELARTVAKTFDAFVADMLHLELNIGMAAIASPPLSLDSLRNMMKTAEKRYPMLRSFTWMSPEGVHLVSTNPAIEHRKVIVRDEFSRIGAGEEPSVSHIYVSPYTGERVFNIYRGIRDVDGKLLGIVSCLCVADKLDPLLAVPRSRDAGIVLIDDQGTYVYLYPAVKVTPEKSNMVKLFPVVAETLKGREVVAAITSRMTGRRRLAAFVPIPSFGWVASYSRDEEEVMAAIRRTLLPQAGLMFLVTLGAFGAAVGLSRPITTSIVKLRNRAQALGRGERENAGIASGPEELRDLGDAFNQMAAGVRVREDALRESEQRWATTLSSIGDAVIAADVAGRITFMNAVAEELTGWTLKDASTRLVTDVFQIINEQTRSAVESPVAKVLREGMIVGLANHTILVKKDGTEVPIDDSGAPIRDEYGNTTGVVLVFRDITERKQAEVRRTHLASFPELNPSPIIETDISGEITFCNPGTLSVLEDLGMDGGDCRRFLPEDLAEALLNWDKKNKSTLHREVRLENRVFAETIHLVPEFNVARIFALDITDRKRAEDEIRKSLDTVRRNEEQLRVLLQNVGSGVALIDEAGKFLVVNRAFLRMFGLNGESDILNINSQDWGRWEVYGEDGKLLQVDDHPVRKAAMTGKPVISQLAAVRNPSVNELAWMLINAEPLLREDGTVYTVVSTYHDITERKQMEEELRKSHDELEIRVRERTEAVQRQADLLELAHNAILVMDMESRITFWNHGAEERYGWTKAEALGNITHAFLKTQFPVPFDEYMGILTKEGRWQGELIHTTKDGRQITVLSRQALQKDNVGRPLAVLEINLDVTEARYTEQQLRQAQKMEALGTLTGGVAHDFNNILAAIIGFTELVADHVPKESREARHLKRVMESSLRGRDLVRQMLTFSRKAEQEKKPLSLSSIVKETAKLIRATTPTTISIRVNVLDESGPILADPTQIQQVIMNLCTNAAHAMREKGGTLDILLSNHSVSPSNGNPDGIKPGLYTRLTVRDNGAGMSPDIMDKIFDPFFTTKKVGEGTGLGLSVVHGIVKQSNGHITVKSELGKGSAFTVYFPQITGELETGEVSDDETPTGSEHILFIDDEETLVEMGEDILAELGYDVTSRMSSTEALALFKLDPSRFDLVITDQTMPEMTGIELAKEILALRADMPIIMCTGFSYVVDANKAEAAGIKAFAMKPLTKREIAKTIRKVLDE